jgi:hypothetical protein
MRNAEILLLLLFGWFGSLGPFASLGFFLAGLRTLRAVFGAAAAAAVDSEAIESAADDVIPDTRKVFDTASSNEDDRVLLKIMPFAWNVRDHLLAVCEANLCDLAQRRVRLLRCPRHYLHTHPAALGALNERR